MSFIDTAATEIYTLSLHDALPISRGVRDHRGAAGAGADRREATAPADRGTAAGAEAGRRQRAVDRSEEHTSELQSLAYLVCRLLLEKKKPISMMMDIFHYIKPPFT